MNSSGASSQLPLVSVVVVNYNCKKWLEPFFLSLRAQTIFNRAEIIMVDNTSKDGSAEMCEKEMATWPGGVFLQTGGNFGFGGGSNRGAAGARGKYLFFLNPDVRLEPDCLEQLAKRAEETKSKVACPLVLDYDSDNIQGQGASGFDFFGCMTAPRTGQTLETPFAVATFYFIERELFQKLGGFDEEFFLYNEEMDLSWRAWIAGESVTLLRSARIHHQYASNGERAVENRTSEKKRFYANRNQLLTILKNADGLLLVLALNQLALITLEAIVGTLLARRLSFMRWSLFKPVAECWRLRHHIRQEREKNRRSRQRGDWWIMRRFFQLGFGRWEDAKRLFKSGLKIDKA
jgi:GT2 family glycosyltransferase